MGGCGPDGAARGAAELPRLHSVLPAADKDGLAADEGFRDRGAPAFQHATDGLPRHAHRRSRLLVTEALEVHETDRLELVDGQRQLLELTTGDAGGLEQRHMGHAANRTFNRWARH
jgi:hypothetical protein